jgi:NO-binding membrane sensor protein with MHYT domain
VNPDVLYFVLSIVLAVACAGIASAALARISHETLQTMADGLLNIALSKHAFPVMAAVVAFIAVVLTAKVRHTRRRARAVTKESFHD